MRVAVRAVFQGTPPGKSAGKRPPAEKRGDGRKPPSKPKAPSSPAPKKAHTAAPAERKAQPPPPSKPARLPAPPGTSWRVEGVIVPLRLDGGKDDYSVSPALLRAVEGHLGVAELDAAGVTIVRKSFDARKKKPVFAYVLDIADDALNDAYARTANQPLSDVEAQLAAPVQPATPPPPPLVSSAAERSSSPSSPSSPSSHSARARGAPTHVVVVGSGPSGLFAALALAEAGVPVTVVERGQPVESRGRSIGALFARRVLDPESNLCYGEGGAGTWSDGKLATGIGRNSTEVRAVLQALVAFGAPPAILVDGKPHLGTDRLVQLLRSLREHLTSLGVTYRWGSKVTRLLVKRGRVAGAELADGSQLPATQVVLALGHSSRQLYRQLLADGVAVSPQGCSVGLRVEHPQDLIDGLQLGLAKEEVKRGLGKVPVADYKLVSKGASAEPQPAGADRTRACYSFCMCPGGQVVPTSTNPLELCVNGMSFSRRASRWANSGIVVPVGPADYAPFALPGEPELAGVAFQEAMERVAARMGGGDLVAPAQTTEDFLLGRLGAPGSLPPSSYRLGVRSARADQIYPEPVNDALRRALERFEKGMPGFVSNMGLLHGIESRTSAPLRIERGEEFESVSTKGVYPVGEGAGYAGGIVSAAVDGMNAAQAIIRELAADDGRQTTPAAVVAPSR